MKSIERTRKILPLLALTMVVAGVPAARAAVAVTCTVANGPAEVGVAYSTTCTPVGGVGPFQWALSAGALPGGITSNPLLPATAASVVISGAATTPGAFSYSLQVTDSTLATGSASFAGNIAAAPTASCNPAVGPTQMGFPYETLCTVAGGTPGYTWTVTGVLPAGLTTSANTGANFTIYGTPSGVGAYAGYSVKATDSASTPQPSNSVAFAAGNLLPGLSVTCTPTAASLTPEVGIPYSVTCNALNDNAGGPFTWTFTGSLPPNVAMAPSVTNAVTFMGTPLAAGTFGYSVVVKDSLNPPQTASRTDLAGQVLAAPTLTCNTANGPVEVMTQYTATCTVSGGQGPYTWSIVSGVLPNGVTLTPNGATAAISGRPTAVGNFSYQVQVTDGASTPQSALSIVFSGTILPVVTASCTTDPGTPEVNVSYSVTCTANGGNGNYNWSQNGLPANLTLTPAGNKATIAGNLRISGNLVYTVQAQDTVPGSQSASVPANVPVAAVPSVTCTPTSGPTEVMVAYSTMCTAAGGTAPLNWTTVGGAPLTLNLSSLTGLTSTLTTTPAMASVGAYTFQVQVTDSAKDATGANAPQPAVPAVFTGQIAAAPSVTCTPATGPVEVGLPYSTTCVVTGGVALYSWVVTGALPGGIAIQGPNNTQSFTLAGTPTAVAAGPFTFGAQVTDSAHVVGTSANITGTIAPAVTVTCASNGVPNVFPTEVHVSYSSTCTAAGGYVPYTWTIENGSLPSGLSIGAPSGPGNNTVVISGAPSAPAASIQYTVQAQDSVPGTPPGTDVFSKVAVPPAKAIVDVPSVQCAPVAGPAGPFESNVLYQTTCTVTNGSGNFNWAITQGSLPGGLTLTPAAAPSLTAVISGRPALPNPPSAGSYPYSYQVQVSDSAFDSNGAAAPQTATPVAPFQGTISTPILKCITAQPAAANAGPAQVGVPYSATCEVTPASGSYVWSTLKTGVASPPSVALPDGLTFTTLGADATISGTPLQDATGPYNYSIQATDSAVDSLGHASPQTAPLVTYTGGINAGISLTCFATNPPTPVQPTEVGVPYSATCTVDVPAQPLNQTHATGTPNYTYSIVGMAPVTITCGLVPCGGVATPNTFITIAGVPTGASAYSYSVKVVDGAPQPQTALVPFTVSVVPPPSVTCDQSAGPTQAGIPYNTTCRVQGGTPPYTWTLVSPDGSSTPIVPPGINLAQVAPGITATVGGTATSAGGYQYAVEVTDSAVIAQSAVSQSFIGNVIPAVGIICANSGVPVEVSVAYTNTCRATGGTPPYSFTVQGSSVAGITLAAPVGSSVATISGSPTSPQTFNYTIQVTDGAVPPGLAVSSPFKGQVFDVPTLSCDQQNGPFQLEVLYTTTCTAKPGILPYTPYTFAVTGNLPPGIAMSQTSDPNVVTISGVPTQTGTYSYALRIVDSNTGSAQQSFTSTISPILRMTVSPPAGDFSVNGKGGTFVLTPTSTSANVTGPVTVSPGQLPAGLAVASISSSDSNWTCTLTDASGNPSCTRVDNPPTYTPIVMTITVTDPVCPNPAGVIFAPVVSLSGLTQFTAASPVQPTGCLVVTKSHQGSFPVAGTGAYALNINNPTSQTISGAIVVSDTLNGLLSVDSSFQTTQPNWNCTATVAGKTPVWTVSCTYTGGPVSPGAQLTPISIPVDVGQITAGQTACGLVTDPASVFLATVDQFDATDATSISGPGCVFVRGVFNAAPAGSASPTPASGTNPPCPASSQFCYNLTVANVGEGVLSDPVSLTLTLPQGFSYTTQGAASANWQCGLDPTGQLVTCSLSAPPNSSSTLDGGAYSILTLGINVDPGAFPCGVQSAELAGTQGSNPLTLPSIPSNVPGGGCLSLTRSYAAAKAQAGVQSSYTLTVGNPGQSAVTKPAISVTETLPAGVTLGTTGSSLSVPGWDDGSGSCTTQQDPVTNLWTLTCTRTDDVPAAGTAYHAITVPFVAATAACPGIFGTAYLNNNNNTGQAVQSSTTDLEPMSGCFSVTRSVVPGGFTLGDSGTYTLTAAYLGQMPVYGQITVTDTLNPGLTPMPLVPVNAGWSCLTTPFSSTQAQPYSITCTRAAVGTFTPIGETTAVDANACSIATSSATVAASIDSGVIQSNSLPVDQTVITPGSGGACPVGQLSAISASSSAVLTPNQQGVTYTINVTNPGMSPTDGVSAVVVKDTFPPGVSPVISQITQQNWDCSASAGLIVSCTRSDALLGMGTYDPISVPVTVSAAACPTATDKVLLTLGNKNQGLPYLDAVQLQGCLTVTPSAVTFPTAALSTPPPQQVVAITATDKNPLSLTFAPPATADFSYTCPTCTTASPCPAGMQCAVLSNGQQVLLNVNYQPTCIGSSADMIQYTTSANPNTTQSVNLSGTAGLSGYTFMLLPSGSGSAQSLTNGLVVQPAQTLNLGLVPASPGYCTGGSQRVTASLAPQLTFTPNGNLIPLQVYDETINAMCPSGATGCIGILGTGTVAGDITVAASFTDSAKGAVSYPGAAPSIRLTVPNLPPVLTNVGKGAVTASSFEIAVTGYSTPRAGTQACFAFTPAAGAVLNTGSLNSCVAMDQIDIWYSRTSSVKTGSTFETTVTFSFAGVSDAIGNVDVKLQNGQGDSGHYCMDFKSGAAKSGTCQ